MRTSMIAAARRTIVLADSAKFNHKLLGHIASLEQTISWSPMRSLQESYSEPSLRLNIFSQCLRPFGCSDYNMETMEKRRRLLHLIGRLSPPNCT